VRQTVRPRTASRVLLQVLSTPFARSDVHAARRKLVVAPSYERGRNQNLGLLSSLSISRRRPPPTYSMHKTASLCEACLTCGQMTRHHYAREARIYQVPHRCLCCPHYPGNRRIVHRLTRCHPPRRRVP
ncbi:unnamed protein product, partial [Ectocarpus sp. 13 AM-2016]